jgi:hypothetical protein
MNGEISNVPNIILLKLSLKNKSTANSNKYFRNQCCSRLKKIKNPMKSHGVYRQTMIEAINSVWELQP